MVPAPSPIQPPASLDVTVHCQSPSTGTALLCLVFIADPCGVMCSITSILQTLLSVLSNSDISSWSAPRHYWKFTRSFGSSVMWLCLMSSHRTVPSCPQKLARTAQDTISVPGVSSPRGLCINTGWCACGLVSGGRRGSSLFCGRCYVWSCEGGRDWDLNLSFWPTASLILEDLIVTVELKVMCSLLPIETCAGWRVGSAVVYDGWTWFAGQLLCSAIWAVFVF